MTPMTWRESLQQPSELEVKRSTQNCPRIQLLRCLEHGRVQFPPFCHRQLGFGEIQEDLEGVKIPENPYYGYDEAYYDSYNYPRAYRMSKKITEDECSRAMGAECNDKIVALTRAGRGMNRLV